MANKRHKSLRNNDEYSKSKKSDTHTFEVLHWAASVLDPKISIAVTHKDLKAAVRWVQRNAVYYCNCNSGLSAAASVLLAVCKATISESDKAEEMLYTEARAKLKPEVMFQQTFETKNDMTKMYLYEIKQEKANFELLNTYAKVVALQAYYEENVKKYIDTSKRIATNIQIEQALEHEIKSVPFSEAHMATGSKLIKVEFGDCARHSDDYKIDQAATDREIQVANDMELERIHSESNKDPAKDYYSLCPEASNTWLLLAWMRHIDNQVESPGHCRRKYVWHWGDWGVPSLMHRLELLHENNVRVLPILMSIGKNNWLVVVRLKERKVYDCPSLIAAISKWHSVVEEFHGGMSECKIKISRPVLKKHDELD